MHGLNYFQVKHIRRANRIKAILAAAVIVAVAVMLQASSNQSISTGQAIGTPVHQSVQSVQVR